MAESKWKRGLVEFAAIFLGVSLSFVAEDWRESLGERRQAVAVLEGIRRDLSQERPGVETSLERERMALEGGLRLETSWTRPDAPTDSIEVWLNRLLVLAPYLPVRAAYESAKASGRIEMVHDELRSQIVEFYEREQADLGSVVQLSTDFQLELQRALRPYVDYHAIGGPLGLTLTRLPVSSTRPGADRNGLRGVREVRNLIAESTLMRRLVVDHAEGYLERQEALLERLAATLDRR